MNEQKTKIDIHMALSIRIYCTTCYVNDHSIPYVVFANLFLHSQVLLVKITVRNLMLQASD